MRWTATAPEVATARILASATGWIYLVAGVAALLVAAAGTPGPGPAGVVAPGLAPLVFLGLGGSGLLVGTLTLLLGRRWPRPLFHLLLAGGTVLVGAGIVCAATTTAAVVCVVVLSFTALAASFFFPPPLAVLHLLGAGTCAIVSLTLRGVPAPLIAASLVTLAGVNILSSVLINRASRTDRDVLTGLPNRRQAEESLTAAMFSAGIGGTPLTVGLLDLDHFAEINDQVGPAGADEVLCRFAAAVSRALASAGPDTDPARVARYGGDEFLVLLPGRTAEEAQTLLDAVRTELDVRFSAGLAQLIPGEDRATLMRRADTALSGAKDAGRDSTGVADSDDAMLAADLAEALVHDPAQLRVVHQPIVHLGTGRVVAVEALCRWVHPARGFVSPADFIPVSESAGLVGALGRLVLQRACADAVRLRAVTPDLTLTVNVSGRQLVTPGFVEEVLDTLQISGLPAAGLLLEVTESVVEGSTPVALGTLRALRAEGVRIAIDDFGTGYSAFSRLDALPADHLKVDAAFTAGITTSPRRAGILQGLLGICDALGLAVVAEGVETAEQAEKLRELGCPLAQGYLFARPEPVEQVLQHLATDDSVNPAAVALSR